MMRPRFFCKIMCGKIVIEKAIDSGGQYLYDGEAYLKTRHPTRYKGNR